MNIYSPYNHTGIISFSINGLDSSQVSNILDDKYHIATRPGLHCAPMIHRYLGTIKNGLTRISLSYFTKKSEIDKLIKAIEEIVIDTMKK